RGGPGDQSRRYHGPERAATTGARPLTPLSFHSLHRGETSVIQPAEASMGKRSRQKRAAHASPAQAAGAPGPAASTTTPTPQAGPSLDRSTRRRWAFRLLVVFGAPAFLLLLLELGLRWSGYGYDTHFFQAHQDAGYLTTNPRFAWQFYSPQTA